MAFGKRSLTTEESAGFRVQADAERERRTWLQVEPVSALEPYVQEELAFLQRVFGDDERLRPMAITLAVRDVFASVGKSQGDREAAIEADLVVERLDAGDAFTERAFAAWAGTVTAPPPSRKAREEGEGGAPFGYAFLSAIELYFAFLLTNGRMMDRKRDRLADAFFPYLRRAVDPIMKKASAKKKGEPGLPFERDAEAIVIDWIARPRHLRAAYRPGAGLHAPRAFLAREFRFDLDDEKRMVGAHAVLPGWIREMRRGGWLREGVPLTGDVVEVLLAQAEARMKRPPPAGFLNIATLTEELGKRQDEGELALRLAKVSTRDHAPAEFAEGQLEAEWPPRVREWFEQPKSSRAPLPVGAVAKKVGTTERSVAALVVAYEKTRGSSFRRNGRSPLIPMGELDRIVEFANARAAKRGA